MGLIDGHSLECTFNEPQGLCSLFKRDLEKTLIYIADTNNHCLRYVDYDSGKVHTLKIGGVPEIEMAVPLTAGAGASAGAGPGDQQQ